MRTKKLSALLLAVVMVCMTFAPVVSAEDVTDLPTATIDCTRKINDEYTNFMQLKKDTSTKLSISDVTYNGEAVEADKIKYQWYSDLEGTNEIPGATSPDYQFNYDGRNGVCCRITIDGIEEGWPAGFWFEEAWSGDSNLPYTESGNTLYLKGVKMGTTGTLKVNGPSDEKTTYEWYYQANDWNNGGMEIIDDATGNTYTFTKKDIGSERYTCFVKKEGEMIAVMSFSISSFSTDNNTLTIDPEINGEKIKSIDIGDDGVGYLYGAPKDKTVTMKINASTTSSSPLTYLWVYTKWTGEGDDIKGEQVIEEGTDTLTVSKGNAYQSLYPPSENGRVGGVEDYECWIEDGNVRRRVLFSLYLTETKAEKAKMSDGSELTVAVDNGDSITENLNSFLTGNAKDALDNGQFVSQIKLSTSEMTDVNAEDKAAILSVLTENSEVGTYLDINMSAVVHEDTDTPAKNILIEETGIPVDITMDIPESMLNTDNTVERKYEVIRVHDNKAESLACEVKDNKITFSTDKFSTYALAYTDTKINAGTGSQGTGNQQTGTPGSSQANAPTQPEFKPVSAAAATGDMSDAGGYALLMFASLGIISGVLIKKKAAR